MGHFDVQFELNTDMAKERDVTAVKIKYANNHVEMAMACHSLTHKMQLLVGVKCLNRCHPLRDMSSAPNNNKKAN